MNDKRSPSGDPGQVLAPFTDEQVRHLTEFQDAGAMHPFTCPHHSRLNLVASTTGWRCPQRKCDYTQNWAHEFMADGSFLKHHRETFADLAAAAECQLVDMQAAVDEVARTDHNAGPLGVDDDHLEHIAALEKALELALKRWPEIKQ